MYSIVFSPIAKVQFGAIVADFEAKQTGLGVKFYDYTIKRIDVLYQFPHLPIVFEPIRVLQLRKYKYRLHYTINQSQKQVIILALIHSKADPQKWKLK